MSEPKTAEVKVVPVPYELLVRARHIIGDRSAGGRMITSRAEAGAVWNELLSIMNAEPAAPASPPAEKGEGEDLAGKLAAIRDKFLIPTPDKDFTDYAIITRCIASLSAQPVSPSEGEATGPRSPDDPCRCFGDSGFQASTHHDADDNERCDLCGGLVAPHPASTERMRAALRDATANLVACAETMRDIRRQTVADGKVRYELALTWAERAEEAAALAEKAADQ